MSTEVVGTQVVGTQGSEHAKVVSTEGSEHASIHYFASIHQSAPMVLYVSLYRQRSSGEAEMATWCALAHAGRDDGT